MIASSPPSVSRSPWRWVPSLYFAQGVPYVVVMTVAVIMFKRLGVGNKEIAFYTSVLYLPWVIKPLWSPIVQAIGSRRGWTVVMQLLVSAGLACVALSIPADSFLRYSLIALAFIAIASATHDIAADGFYLLALTSHEQAWFVGIRSTAYRFAMIAGQGLLVMLAGQLEATTGLPVIKLEVAASDSARATLEFSPPERSIADSAVQRVVLADDEVTLSLRGRSRADVQSLIDQARAWNVEHGFYAAPTDAESKAQEKTSPGWRIQLEDWIRRRFGPDAPPATTASDRSGDAAVVWMRLAQPVPEGVEQIVQFGRAAGDASFQVVEGERFSLNESNWSAPFAAVVEVDAKLDESSAAWFDVRSGNLTLAWSATFFVVAGLFLLIGLYHLLVLPRPAGDLPAAGGEGYRLAAFIDPLVEFFRKPRIIALLAFLLLYRLPESQLVKLATPFLLDPREQGGLALTTGEVGFVYGTVGVIMLTVGGILGGFVAARHGLKRWLWPMAIIIHLPNLAFLFLAYAQPESIWITTAAVGVEQFGYGFGFTAYMLYCIYIARGEHQTVHYALCTGCMALGMMIPGMWSGWLQQLIGYEHFFAWVMICTIPSFATVAFIPLDAEFGKKQPEEGA
ncbi:MAG: MFS transporter [Pirellulales bacterium]|nr:MFS transporter [Pirellulales bacterium]